MHHRGCTCQPLVGRHHRKHRLDCHPLSQPDPVCVSQRPAARRVSTRVLNRDRLDRLDRPTLIFDPVPFGSGPGGGGSAPGRAGRGTAPAPPAPAACPPAAGPAAAAAAAPAAGAARRGRRRGLWVPRRALKARQLAQPADTRQPVDPWRGSSCGMGGLFFSPLRAAITAGVEDLNTVGMGRSSGRGRWKGLETACGKGQEGSAGRARERTRRRCRPPRPGQLRRPAAPNTPPRARPAATVHTSAHAAL